LEEHKGLLAEEQEHSKKVNEICRILVIEKANLSKALEVMTSATDDSCASPIKRRKLSTVEIKDVTDTEVPKEDQNNQPTVAVN